MIKLEGIHKSFLPVIYSGINQEPLKSLFESILPAISFQPREENIFKVFRMPIDRIKIVVIGQDPYSIPNKASGLCFLNETNKVSNSLKNIYREINSSTDMEGDIHCWEQQGIFLLNSALTVETGNPGSHISYWELFTSTIIRYISYKNPCIWFLWGKMAQKFEKDIYSPFIVKGYDNKLIQDIPISNQYNYILKAPYPVTESYSKGTSGFYGCNHFKYANVILEKLKETKIQW